MYARRVRAAEDLLVAQPAQAALGQPAEAQRIVGEADDAAQGEHRGARPEQAGEEPARTAAARDRERDHQPRREHDGDGDGEQHAGEVRVVSGKPASWSPKPKSPPSAQ